MQRKYNATTEARRRSRERIGKVPGSKIRQDKRRKPIKHKKDQND